MWVINLNFNPNALIVEGMDPLDHINPGSWKETTALGDQNMRLLKQGDLLQLNRKGYYIVDRPYISDAAPMLLISVPDGWVKKEKMRM